MDQNAMSTVATRKRPAIAEVNGESVANTITPTRMAAAEKIGIALPPEMVSLVRNAVATGEYVSSSEVIRDALRDWRHQRTLRQQGIPELRQPWQEALRDHMPPKIAVDDVLDRLERKYQPHRRCRRHGEVKQLELSRCV